MITAAGSGVSLEGFMFLRRCGPLGWTPGEGSGNDHKSKQHTYEDRWMKMGLLGLKKKGLNVRYA